MFDISKFSKWPPFWSSNKLFTVSDTGSGIYQHDIHAHFWCFELLIDALATKLYIAFSKLDLLGDVIGDVMSAWNITYIIRHYLLYTCKILLGWHQSFIIKSSGQTSWQTHNQTNKHSGWKHYHLAITGDKNVIVMPYERHAISHHCQIDVLFESLFRLTTKAHQNSASPVIWLTLTNGN